MFALTPCGGPVLPAQSRFADPLGDPPVAFPSCVSSQAELMIEDGTVEMQDARDEAEPALQCFLGGVRDSWAITMGTWPGSEIMFLSAMQVGGAAADISATGASGERVTTVERKGDGTDRLSPVGEW